METPTAPYTDDCFESLISGLIDNSYGSCDHFFPPADLAGFRANLLRYHNTGGMRPAGIGKNFDYQKNVDIRGDVIRWINNDSTDLFEKKLLAKVKLFITYLNESCYTGINDFEFHYAYYDEGSFYKRHLDRFKSDKGREFSFVLYLNNNWQPENDGRLTLYRDGEEISLYPIEGRVVFFKSDQTEHQVHASTGRPRLSIAGWLKRV